MITATALKKMDFDEGILGKVLFFCAVIFLSTLASISRLLSEVHLTDTDDDKVEITKGIVFTYICCGLTSGLIIAFTLLHYYGFSFALIGLAGAAGFGSLQILTTLALALNEIVKRIFGRK